MHAPDPHHPDETIARIVTTDPVQQDLQKTIAGFAHGKIPHSTFVARDADELALEGKNLPELKKLFGNYILEGAAVLFPSERGVGKTFFLMQLCLAVSKGYDHFLNEPIELHGNTLYLDFELGERAFKRRLAKLYTPTGPPSRHKMLVVNAKGSLTRSIDKFTELIEQCKPVLVVVDNLRTAFRETDNEKNSAMTALIAGLMDLKNEKGFSLGSRSGHYPGKNRPGQEARVTAVKPYCRLAAARAAVPGRPTGTVREDAGGFYPYPTRRRFG
jgi:RecA-family ATPase